MSIKIAVEVGGARRALVLEDVDFSLKRDKVALDLGRQLIDLIWKEVEG